MCIDHAFLFTCVCFRFLLKNGNFVEYHTTALKIKSPSLSKVWCFCSLLLLLVCLLTFLNKFCSIHSLSRVATETFV